LRGFGRNRRAAFRTGCCCCFAHTANS
jgi:hypothetical protein